MESMDPFERPYRWGSLAIVLTIFALPAACVVSVNSECSSDDDCVSGEECVGGGGVLTRDGVCVDRSLESGENSQDCEEDETFCDGECVDIDSDHEHCGGCGQVCSADVEGAVGVCVEGSCGEVCEVDDEQICGGGCVDVNSDVDHCGDCNQACDSSELIDGGVAQCVDGQCDVDCAMEEEEICDSQCVDPDSDLDHCGGCGLHCASGECTDGQCEPFACEPEQSTIGGGSGVREDPYTICRPSHLEYLREEPEANFALSQDVDLSGGPFEPISGFEGTLDGFGFTIEGLGIYIAGQNGLFSSIGPAGEVRDLMIVDAVVEGTTGVGILAGLHEGKTEDVFVQGEVVGRDSVGGLIGIGGGVTSNCLADADVQSDAEGAGGLVGALGEDGYISSSEAIGDVSGEEEVGGLVGRVEEKAMVEASTAAGDVMGAENIGGLIGRLSDGEVYDCYATGAVDGDEFVGGLVGELDASTVTRSYAIGMVYGEDDVGGLIGDDRGGTVEDSFWDVETSAIEESAAGQGLETADFADAEVFDGWDFESIWIISDMEELEGESHQRPRLQWEVE